MWGNRLSVNEILSILCFISLWCVMFLWIICIGIRIQIVVCPLSVIFSKFFEFLSTFSMRYYLPHRYPTCTIIESGVIDIRDYGNLLWNGLSKDLNHAHFYVSSLGLKQFPTIEPLSLVKTAGRRVSSNRRGHFAHNIIVSEKLFCSWG